MNIPFLDVGATYRELKPELDAAVIRSMESGWYILGTEVEAFEAEFATYCGARHGVGVGNGLDAMQLILRAMDIGAGDEVIVPSNTYIATWLAVSHVGATPVPVEPDPRTCNLDPARVAAAITPRTRALLPVHLYGQPADLDPLLDIAHTRGLRVLEDAAQAQVCRYKGRRIGAHSDAVAWSFYPGKNLGAFGDAGAVTTNKTAIAERVRALRNYGSRVKYVNEERGFNSRLDPLQAAVLRVKLPKLEEWNERRARIAALYLAELGDIPELELPFVPDWAEPAWHIFLVQTALRDALQSHLGTRGIGTLIHYPIPPHRQLAYSGVGYPAGAFPLAEKIAQNGLSLPIGPHLHMEQAQEVAAAIRNFFVGIKK